MIVFKVNPSNLEGVAVHLQYQHVEAIFAEALAIRQSDRKAFRARLRHLRNLGIPEVDRPGKGRSVDFSEDDLSELVVAVLLSRAGLGPTAIRDLIVRSRHMLRKQSRAATDRNNPIYLAVLPATFGGAPGEIATFGVFFGPYETVMKQTMETIDKPILRTAVLMNLTSNVSHVLDLARAMTA